jgi:hypothetical protein
MRNFLLPVVTILPSGLVHAQVVDRSLVPVNVQSAFAKKYPGQEAMSWEMENGAFEARFEQRGKKNSANVRPGGKFTESETRIAASDLPAGALDPLRYPNAGVRFKEAPLG